MRHGRFRIRCHNRKPTINTYPVAKSYANPAGSPVSELFSYLSQPGIFSFAGGYPSPSLFDSAGLQNTAQRAMTQVAVSFQYDATEGAMSLRDTNPVAFRPR